MPLLARIVSTPVAVHIKQGAVNELEPLLADGRISARGDVAIAVGPGQGEALAERLRGSLPRARTFQVQGGSVEGAQELITGLREHFFDAVVGIGGGKTLDAGKYAATMVGLPFVAVATNLAHDGIASPVASLENKGRKSSIGVHTPIAVVVDLDLVAQSPARQTRSGIGDVLSNLNAIADWELAARETGESVDGLAVALARSGAQAIVGRREDLTDPRFLKTLAEALFMSGMAMVAAGNSRPCSGACHEISHAMDALFDSPGLHGEQVAIGALFASWLRGDPDVELLNQACRDYELPRVPADLGMSVEEFIEAVVQAPATRPDRYTVLEHLRLTPEETEKRVHEYVDAFTD